MQIDCHTNDNITIEATDTGLMQELIEDALHLSHDQNQIEESEYQQALEFVRNCFEQGA